MQPLNGRNLKRKRRGEAADAKAEVQAVTRQLAQASDGSACPRNDGIDERDRSVRFASVTEATVARRRGRQREERTRVDETSEPRRALMLVRHLHRPTLFS